MLRGDRVHLEGEHVKFFGGSLTFTPIRADVPIYVASRGNRVLEMAGEVADGVMIATYATPPGVRHALGRIDAGLATPAAAAKTSSSSAASTPGSTMPTPGTPAMPLRPWLPA